MQRVILRHVHAACSSVTLFMNKLLKSFGERVWQKRIEKGLSQEEFAFRVGVHRTYVGMVERAERNVTLVTIHKFAKALDISISELLSNIEDD